MGALLHAMVGQNGAQAAPQCDLCLGWTSGSTWQGKVPNMGAISLDLVACQASAKTLANYWQQKLNIGRLWALNHAFISYIIKLNKQEDRPAQATRS